MASIDLVVAVAFALCGLALLAVLALDGGSVLELGLLALFVVYGTVYWLVFSDGLDTLREWRKKRKSSGGEP